MKLHICRAHSNLVLQLEQITGEKMCQIVGATFKTKKGVKDHEAIHVPHRPHECRWCGKRFRMMIDLQSNYFVLLGSLPPQNCALCSAAHCWESHCRRPYRHRRCRQDQFPPILYPFPKVQPHLSNSSMDSDGRVPLTLLQRPCFF